MQGCNAGAMAVKMPWFSVIRLRMITPETPSSESCAAVYEFRLKSIDLRLPDGLATPEIVAKLAEGTYEEDEAHAAMHCVQPVFRVLELGAGLGYVTALCAQRTAAQNILTVEANPDLLPVITANLARNGASAVRVVHAAATGAVADGAMAEFAVSPGFPGSSLTGKGRKIQVPLVSVHTLLREHRPHVVLIDIEGAEAALFDRVWKCPLRFCVIELHPKKYPPRVVKKIVDTMSRMGMTYDPACSRGKVIGFRKVWGADEASDDETQNAAP